ncbi:hypothetical protein [Streptomyces sp. LN785]|uniref:hypothetical protein n=1 Tax=Streptomyces sp. LN785 TaxID=3112983 RepID=UPI00371DC588
MARTRTAMVLSVVERLCSSETQLCTVRSTTRLVIIRAARWPMAGTTRVRRPAGQG